MYIQKGIICEEFIKSPIWRKNSSQGVFTKRIKFPSSYKQPPFVQLSVERLDSGAFIEQSSFSHDNRPILHTVTRYDVSAQDVSGSEFTLRFSTWGGNAIYGFRISWIAFGEKAPEVQTANDQIAELFLQYLKHEKWKHNNDNHS